MSEIKIAVMNLKKRRFELKLTVYSIVIGLMSVILIASLGNNSKEMILDSIKGVGMTGLLFSHNSGGVDGISFKSDTLESMETDEETLSVMPLSFKVTNVSLAEQTNKALVFGVGDTIEKYVDMELCFGRLPDENDIESCGKVAVITEKMATELLGRENALGQELFIGKEKVAYTVIGVITSQTAYLRSVINGLPEFVYVPYTAYEEYNGVCATNLLVNSNVLGVTETQERIVKNLRQQYGESITIEVTNFEEGKNGVGDVAEILSSSLTLSASVSLLVAGFGIISAMIFSVHERRQDIGIMEALGANRKKVARIFFEEGLMITLFGILNGILMGIGLVWFVSKLTVFEFKINWSVVFLATVSSLLFGVLSGVIPAYWASKQDPIEALKR